MIQRLSGQAIGLALRTARLSSSTASEPQNRVPHSNLAECKHARNGTLVGCGAVIKVLRLAVQLSGIAHPLSSARFARRFDSVANTAFATFLALTRISALQHTS
jgi:hypothetical protein